MFEEVTASSLVKVDVNGNPVEPTPFITNPAGFTIHSAIHMARDDAHAVMHLHTPAGQAVSAHEEALLPLTQTAMLIRGDLSFHDYEGVAVDLDERERLVADLGDEECDDPAQPRHARGRQECRRVLHPALLSRARVPGADHGALGGRAGSATRRKVRPSSPPSKARSACRLPRTCSPGRRSSARPTASTRASRAELARKAAIGQRLSRARQGAAAAFPVRISRRRVVRRGDAQAERRGSAGGRACGSGCFATFRRSIFRPSCSGKDGRCRSGWARSGSRVSMPAAGEVQAARAAAAAGVPFSLSTLSACSIGEVARRPLHCFWFQLYIVKDRGFVRDMIARAREAGCGALLLTVDLAVPGIALPRLSLGPVRIDPRTSRPHRADICSGPTGLGTSRSTGGR